MEKKLRLYTGITSILIGAVVFIWLIFRFFNQGYFGGGSRIFYVVDLEMKDWFGSILYSLLFSLFGIFIIVNHKLSTLLCQFISIGLIIERLWSVLERLNDGKVIEFLIPMLIIFFCLIYLIISKTEINYKSKVKRIGLIILINLVLISLGKFLLAPDSLSLH